MSRIFNEISEDLVDLLSDLQEIGGKIEDSKVERARANSVQRSQEKESIENSKKEIEAGLIFGRVIDESFGNLQDSMKEKANKLSSFIQEEMECQAKYKDHPLLAKGILCIKENEPIFDSYGAYEQDNKEMGGYKDILSN